MEQRRQGFDPTDVQTPALQVVPCWEFDVFRVDLRDERLWRGTEVLPLAPKTCAVLYCLVRQAGHLVTKEALLGAVWPKTAVREAVIQVAIRQLRRALGDQAHSPRFIETVHGRGYRFIAPLRPLAPSAYTAMPEGSHAALPPLFIPPPHLVGRDPALVRLAQW